MHSHIIMLTDVSGSMKKIDQAACEGFNTFIKEQREVPGTADLQYIRFNTSRSTAYNGPIEQAPLLRSLGPGGGTALYDALIETINELQYRFQLGSTQVIFVVLTDGEDLNSRYSRFDAARAVHKGRELGWQFVFLGANIDAEKTAVGLGIDRELAYQFAATAESTRSVYAQASATTRAMRSWGL